MALDDPVGAIDIDVLARRRSGTPGRRCGRPSAPATTSVRSTSSVSAGAPQYPSISWAPPMYSSPTWLAASTTRPASSTRWKVTPGWGRPIDTVPPAIDSGVTKTWVTAMVVSVGPYRLNTVTWGAAAHRARMSATELASPPRATTPRSVSASWPIWGLDEQEPQVAGREAGVGDGLTLDGREERAGEQQGLAGPDDHRSPGVQGGEQRAERSVEVERRHAQGAGVPVQPEGLGGGRHGGGEGAVADEHPFGGPGGSRGVDGVGPPLRGTARRGRLCSGLSQSANGNPGPGVDRRVRPGVVPVAGRRVVRSSDVTTSAGAQSARMPASRAGGSVVARGTKMAPVHRQARAATTKSTELGRWRATRSPSTTPRAERPAATAAAASRSSSVGQVLVQVFDRGSVGSGGAVVEDHGQDVRRGQPRSPRVPTSSPRSSPPGSSPVCTPSSKVTAPRFMVHR